MARFWLARFALPLLFLLIRCGAAPAAEAPPVDRTLESGWSAEGFVDPGFEAERAQIAFDDGGQAISVWGGRLNSVDPFQIRWSKLTGTAWSPSVPVFAPTTASERLPQLSRAVDGTIWMAWLRDNNDLGSTFHPPSLMTARLVGGTWSAPETVVVETPLLNEKALKAGFSILALSQDEAWLAWSIAPDGDPFSSDRDLMYAVHSAAGWSSPQILSNNVLTESDPVLVATTSGAPAAFYAFSSASSLMQGTVWTGTEWSPRTQLNALAIYGFDAAPDTSGAVRLIVNLREDVSGLSEYHIREFTWNDTGFHSGLLLDSAPVVAGAENNPPDWSNVSISSGRSCPICVSPLYDLVFRVIWIDFTQSGAPKVLSSQRTMAGFQPYDQVGTSFETARAFPSAVHDIAVDRWYATWTAPPTFSGRNRAKFAFTQEFAGDIALGAAYIAPDTVRVSVVCSGDATGRTFRLYRLDWPEGQGSPPFSPPVPTAAVALPGNPFSGPCPFQVDDFPGPGRWFYYLELEAQGTFPARSARSFNPAVVPSSGGGGNGGVTRLLGSRPNPAVGSVNLPFDLATDGEATLVIRDLRGRAVRRIELGPLAAGPYRYATAPTWDGTSDDGRAVLSGMYFVTLLVDSEPAGDPVRVVFLRGHRIVQGAVGSR
jgi:hypothetical protein